MIRVPGLAVELLRGMANPDGSRCLPRKSSRRLVRRCMLLTRSLTTPPCGHEASTLANMSPEEVSI